MHPLIEASKLELGINYGTKADTYIRPDTSSGANVLHLPALPPQGGASIVPSQNGTNVYQSPPGVPPRCLHPDERTFFVTFSNGSPLTVDELLNFFRTCYRIEAESVYIEEPSTIRDLQYAHATFYNLGSVEYVLNGHAKVKFRANGKHLRACRFIPRRRRSWGQNSKCSLKWEAPLTVAVAGASSLSWSPI